MFGKHSRSAAKPAAAENTLSAVTTTRPAVLRRLRELVQNTRGAEMVEMIVIVAVVISLVYAGMKVFGSQVSAALSSQGSAISQIGGGS